MFPNCSLFKNALEKPKYNTYLTIAYDCDKRNKQKASTLNRCSSIPRNLRIEDDFLLILIELCEAPRMYQYVRQMLHTSL